MSVAYRMQIVYIKRYMCCSFLYPPTLLLAQVVEERKEKYMK